MGKGRRLKESDHAFRYTGLLLPSHIVAMPPGEVRESNLSTPGVANDHVAPTSYQLWLALGLVQSALDLGIANHHTSC